MRSKFRSVLVVLVAVLAVSAVAAAAASAHEWKANGVGITTAKAVSSSGGAFTMTYAGLTITCQAVTDTGTVEAAGKGKATSLKFEKCRTGTTGCEVKNEGGKLGATEIPTLLEEVGGKLVEKFEQKKVGLTKEIVTLEFEGAPCAGTGYGTGKLKGDMAAEVKNESDGEVKLTFPTTQIPQTPQLEVFGFAFSLTGTVNEKLVSGEKLTAV